MYTLYKALKLKNTRIFRAYDSILNVKNVYCFCKYFIECIIYNLKMLTTSTTNVNLT